MSDGVSIRCPHCSAAHELPGELVEHHRATPFVCRNCRRPFDPFPPPLHVRSPEQRPAELHYYSSAGDGEAEEELTGIRNGTPLRSLLLSLAATSVTIAVALLEPPPHVRQVVFGFVALAAVAGVAQALLALLETVSHVERTLIVAALGLGGLSVAAVFILF